MNEFVPREGVAILYLKGASVTINGTNLTLQTRIDVRCNVQETGKAKFTFKDTYVTDSAMVYHFETSHSAGCPVSPRQPCSYLTDQVSYNLQPLQAEKGFKSVGTKYAYFINFCAPVNMECLSKGNTFMAIQTEEYDSCWYIGNTVASRNITIEPIDITTPEYGVRVRYTNGEPYFSHQGLVTRETEIAVHCDASITGTPVVKYATDYDQDLVHVYAFEVSHAAGCPL